MSSVELNPAEQAAVSCMTEVNQAIEDGRHFLVEAGAGAGKTYTLIEALKILIQRSEQKYLQTNKKIACITYTNVAKDEIQSRTDNHPVVFAETIHVFCWQIIKDFQKAIRPLISTLTDRWPQRIEEAGGVEGKVIKYDLGYPKVTDNAIYLHHDDVIKLMSKLLYDQKFRNILRSRYPVILIDEYQDTNKELAKSIVENLIEIQGGPLIGFFGDHWQKIYGSKSCGLIEAAPEHLITIGKQANFRSDRLLVEALNRIRPELQQHARDPQSLGEIDIFHSNNFTGVRKTRNHWQGDLPDENAHNYLQITKQLLLEKGWDFTPGKTKILMLTNAVLANEQGYSAVNAAFGEAEDYLKKSDAYIEFLCDIVEPASIAFENGRYGQMYAAMKMKNPKIKTHADKTVWHQHMSQLLDTRKNGTIGDVIDLLKNTGKPRLSSRLVEKENNLEAVLAKPVNERNEAEVRIISKISSIREIPYDQLINVNAYIDDQTLFSTKHGVKGAQFENTLIVCGRGWNNYDWDKMLRDAPNEITPERKEAFERNRNLFYVACSRPKHRLALLFTQLLSADALNTLQAWFGDNISAITEPE